MFKNELQYYIQNKDELVQNYENRFLVIKGKELLGAYDTEKDAYKAGLEAFGNVPFLIKKVTKQEEIVRFPALAVGVVNADI